MSDYRSDVNIGPILTVLNLAAQYGIPTVIKAIHTFSNQDRISLADLQQMEMKLQEPRSYFNKNIPEGLTPPWDRK